MESAQIYTDLSKIQAGTETAQVMVERDNNKEYEFPPKSLQKFKIEEINKRLNLKDSLKRFDSNSTADSNHSKDGSEFPCTLSTLPELSLNKKSTSYQSYLTERITETQKKSKRSYYWKINELAILYMVSFFTSNFFS